MNNKAFTLIEVVVAITIFSLFMVSMIMIYASSSNINWKINISSSMQENTKNIIETIAEDIRKNGISGVSRQNATDNCNFNKNYGLYKKGDKLCVGTDSYYLAQNVGGTFIRVDSTEIGTICGDIKNECILVKDDGTNITRLSNSRIRFKKLEFLVSNEFIPKVTIVYSIQPSIKKGVKVNTIKNTYLNFQTTITQKLIKSN